MNIETNRLNTFTNWPASAPVDPIRIAKAGFFFTGEGTEVQCFSCGGKISEWNYGDQVMWRHRNMEPNCAFVVNPQLSGNVPLVLGRECPVETSIVSVQQPSSIETQQSSGATEEDDMYKSDALRLLSFINWDVSLLLGVRFRIVWQVKKVESWGDGGRLPLSPPSTPIIS